MTLYEQDAVPTLPFDLATPLGWQALGRAYQSAHAADLAAIDARAAAERAADADRDTRPVAPNETHSDACARVQHNEVIRARHGVPDADARPQQEVRQ